MLGSPILYSACASCGSEKVQEPTVERRGAVRCLLKMAVSRASSDCHA